MAADLTSSQFLTKTLWPQKRVQNLVYQDNPLFAMVPKDEGFVGDSAYIAVRSRDGQARNTVFSDAQAGAQLTGGPASGQRFLLTRVRNYQIASIDNEAIDATGEDKGALLSVLDNEIEAAMNNIGRAAAIDLFRDGTGARGTRGSISGEVITLGTADDVTNFEVGMRLVFAQTASGALRAFGSGSAWATVAAVDRDLGKITLTTGDAARVTSFTDGDSIFAMGDAQAGGSMKVLAGLGAWIPSTAPTSTTFFGVDRSSDPTRLGGLRVDASGLNPEEGLVLAGSRLGREGGRPSHQFMNHKDYRNVLNAIGTKVLYETATIAGVSFTGVRVHSDKGSYLIFADQNCPASKSYLLTMSSLKLMSLKGMPRILNRDGNKMLREYNADRVEVRIGYYAQLACDAPGFNAVVSLPT